MINNRIIEQTNSLKYFGCQISMYSLNYDLENNIRKYN